MEKTAAPLAPSLGFTKGESTWLATRRIALGELSYVHQLLLDAAVDPHVAVHQTRKAIKRLRALLRLIERPLRHSFDKLDKRLRDASRSLAKSREALAALEALEALAERADETEREHISWVRGLLLLDAPKLVVVRGLLLHVRGELVQLEQRIAGWPDAEAGFELVERGYRHSYRRARRALAVTQRRGSLDDFHELRKATKAHQHQLAYLEPLAPELLAARRLELAELSELLGAHHDIGLLRNDFVARGFVDLADRAKARYLELEREIGTRAERAFAERARTVSAALAASLAP
jgi:CHAD domain-containing protein